MSIALNIIAKDEKEALLDIISKYSKYFDEICIAIDSEEVYTHINKCGGNIRAFHYTHKNEDGLLDFAHKRNFIKDLTGSEYIFRLDTDDTIENPAIISSIVDDMVEGKINIITCMYDYSKDEWGNSNAIHYRETIIENTDNLYWNMPIHECILPKNPSSFSMMTNEELKITHNIDSGHAEKSAKRNLVYLKKDYERNRDKTDPRTLGYLARTLHGLGDLKSAIFFYEKHIEGSGWKDDRWLSWCQLGTIFKLLRDVSKAKACAFEALQERPDFPDAYFLLHDIYFNEEKWQESLEWAEMGFKKPFPRTNIFIDPSSYTWQPMLSTAECYFQLGKFEDAAKVLDSAKKFIPDHKYIKSAESVYREALEHHRFVDKFMWLFEFIRAKDKDKVKSLLDIVPKELYQHEVIAKIRNEFTEPKVWGEKEVTIFCGMTPMEWSPKDTAKGIGGSESAVIYMSQELHKLGYKVTVFNACGEDEGVYDGVEYKNLVYFNPKDSFNILISWRANIFAYKIQARRKIVWLHDLPKVSDWNEDACRAIDKVVALSHYHASLLPDTVPKEKIYLSTNGIKPDDFLELGGIKRNPKRIIYASSYDRGLEQMLEMWSDIRKAVPDAELHAYYGWNTYDNYLKRGLIPDEGFKPRMLELFKQEGVFEHGRVGHKELLKEYAKSGVYAYYCTYPGEINCIALTKAVACGCNIVTNDRYVMGERNPFAVTNDNFKDNLIDALNKETLAIGDDNYIKNNSWESIATDWSKYLFPLEIPVEVQSRFKFIWDNIEKNKETIVDIGSNKGHIFGGWDRKFITSVDMDDYDLENFIRADATDLPLEDKKFDVALLAEILEHIPEPVKALSEARRVAKRVMVTVPYEHEWGSDIKPFNTLDKEIKRRGMSAKDLARFGNPAAKDIEMGDGGEHLYHIRYYTPETLKEDLVKAGFTNIKVVKLRKREWVWLGAIASD